MKDIDNKQLKDTTTKEIMMTDTMWSYLRHVDG